MAKSNGSNGSNGNGHGRGGAVVPLSQFRATRARPSGAARVDALISAPDTEGAVAALSVPELYALVKDVGFADTMELIALATPEQIRGCLDVEIWDRDRVQDEAVRPWLSVIMEAGYEKLGQVWEALDPELAALILARWTRIYDLSLEEEVPEESELPIITTPDTFFGLEITASDDEDVKLVIQLISDLYKADMTTARHTLMSARSEPMAELEEMSYRWRAGRMADLGYTDYYEALEVFRPLDPASIEIGEATAEDIGSAAEGDETRVPRALPMSMIDAVSGASFLARALDRIDDPAEVQRLETTIVFLVNRVLSAARADPGDSDAVRSGAAQAAATLSLGLESITGGDLEVAERALRTVSLTRLHRAGFSVTLKLSRLARALAPRGVTASDTDRAVLAALLGARQWFACELDTPPASGVRAFASVADVRRTADHLTRLALRMAIAEQALGADLAELSTHPEPRPELDDFARTALARTLAGGEVDAAPLGVDELPRDLSPAARAGAYERFAARLDEVGVSAGREYLEALVDSWLEELEQLLAGLTNAPDARFVTGILLRGE
jgi:hypothetical protein